MSSYGRVVLLGAATGMRSMVGAAVLSRSEGVHPAARTVLRLAAAGEMMVDKLPGIPDRIAAGPLAARVVMGAIGGAVLARRLGRPAMAGLLVGGAAAWVGAVTAFRARQLLTAELGMPDMPVAVLEDLVCVGAGRVAVGVQRG